MAAALRTNLLRFLEVWVCGVGTGTCQRRHSIEYLGVLGEAILHNLAWYRARFILQPPGDTAL